MRSIKLNLFFKSARLICTDRQGLAFFTEQGFSALGARFLEGHIPRRKIALGIIFAAVKCALGFAVFHHDLTAALGARRFDFFIFLLCELALGIL